MAFNAFLLFNLNSRRFVYGKVPQILPMPLLTGLAVLLGAFVLVVSLDIRSGILAYLARFVTRKEPRYRGCQRSHRPPAYGGPEKINDTFTAASAH